MLSQASSDSAVTMLAHASSSFDFTFSFLVVMSWVASQVTANREVSCMGAV